MPTMAGSATCSCDNRRWVRKTDRALEPGRISMARTELMQCGYRKAAQPRVKSGKQGLYRDMLPRKARSIEEPCCTADALCHTPPNRAIAYAWHFNASAGTTE